MSIVTKTPFSFYRQNNTRYVFIDGLGCLTLADCYQSLQQQLSIPDYFGNNLDALDEVLSDLDWIEEKNVKIIIANYSRLLSKELGRKQDFLKVLENSENSFLEIIYLKD